jgi:uncharacterized protein
MVTAPTYNTTRANNGSETVNVNPSQLSNFPQPILITNAGKDPNEVFVLVKEMVEHLTAYKDAAKGTEGWKLEAKMMIWTISNHESAVRAWKELGRWSIKAQDHFGKCITRQVIIKAPWDIMTGKGSMHSDALNVNWPKARALAIRRFGFKSIFKQSRAESTPEAVNDRPISTICGI